MDPARSEQLSKSISDLNNKLSNTVDKLEQKFIRNNLRDKETFQLVHQIANYTHKINEQLQLTILTREQIPIAETIRKLVAFSNGAIHHYENGNLGLYYDELLKFLRPQMKLYTSQKRVLVKFQIISS